MLHINTKIQSNSVTMNTMGLNIFVCYNQGSLYPGNIFPLKCPYNIEGQTMSMNKYDIDINLIVQSQVMNNKYLFQQKEKDYPETVAFLQK